MNTSSLINRLILTTLLIATFANCILLAQNQGLCEGENANLDCLKKNFDALAYSNYKLFWSILHDAAKKMQEHKTLTDVTNFMELSPIIKGNAEVSEFFGEICELFLFSNPTICLDAIISLDDTTKEELLFKLRYPITIPKSEMDNFFSKYKNREKYKEIVELYFKQDYPQKRRLENVTIDSQNIKITVSSVLIEKNRPTDFYSKHNLLDNNNNTTWAEGAKGDGIGEWIQFDFDSEYVITGIDMIVGYVKSKRIFKANNRVKEVELMFSDGTKENLIFKDHMDWQQKFIPAKVTRYLRFIIRDIYKGSKYEDTCISEIKVRGNKIEQ